MKKINLQKWRLHWIGAGLIFLTMALIEARVLFVKGTLVREALKYAHYIFGTLALGFSFYRIIYNRINPSQYRNDHIDPSKRMIMNISHLLLLGAIVIVGLIGGVGYLFDLDQLTYRHKQFALWLYYPIGIHLCLVLYHHFFLKDDVLKRYL